jgi:hypothetical protein
MRITVQPGDVMVASVNVKRHPGGIYTVQIATPHELRPGVSYGSTAKTGQALSQVVSLYPVNSFRWSEGTSITLTPESNEEEEAFHEGLFDVLDDYSRYAVTLIAIPASVLEESEEAGMWEPQGNVDYLTP